MNRDISEPSRASFLTRPLFHGRISTWIVPALSSTVVGILALAAPAFPAGADARQQALAEYFSPQTIASLAVTATDGVFEDRVVVRWPRAINPNVFWRVRRAGVLLTVLSSQDTSYSDTSGVAGQVYSYCVALMNATTKDSLDVGCDNGSRVIFAPNQITATDGLFDSGVFITWNDRSTIEANYRVYRNGTLLATLPVNREAYTDTSATPGVTYSYCVRAVDAIGQMSAQACDDGQRGFVTPPAQVTASDGQYPGYVLITWKGPANPTGFHVYRDASLIATLPDTARSYQDASGTNHVTYNYCVTSTNAQNQESVKICDTGGRGILPAPANVAASDAIYDDKVRISWSDPGETEDGFRIYRQAPGQGSLLITATAANATSYDDVDAVPGVIYRYCVLSFSNGGGVSDSTCDLGRRSAIVAPTSVQATDGTLEDRVDVTWESSATNAVLFNIYRDGAVIQTVSATARSASDFAVAPDVHHTYCVRAVTALEVESAAGCDDGYRSLDAPTELTASDDAFESHVLLSWKDNSSFETGYVIERAPAAASFSIVESVDAGRTSYLDSKGTPGLQYTYRVRALDGRGTAAAGPTDLGSRTLAAPSSVAATDGDYENKIVLTWVDQSAAEIGYRIYRKSGASSYAVLDTVPANTGTYRDSAGIAFGATYTYKVAAYDKYGESAGISDDGHTAMLAPGDVNASDSYPDKVTISWVDRSNIETGYVVTRNGTTLTTTGVNATNYTDNTAAAGTSYTYCVQATSATTHSELACDTGIAALPPSVVPIVVTPVTPPVNLSNWKTITAHGDDAAYTTQTAGLDTLHLLSRSNGAWSEIKTIGGNSSYAKAIDLDVKELIIGNGGSAQIFTNSSGTWGSPFTITAGGSLFGESVAIFGDRAIVVDYDGTGGSGGKAYVYHLSSGTWSQEAIISSPGVNQFGFDVDLDGTRAIISSQNATHIYVRGGTTWTLEKTIPLFGASVGIDGNTAVIADLGGAHAFTLANGNWSETGTFPYATSPPKRVAVEGNFVLVGTTGGPAALFEHQGAGWVQVHSIVPSDGYGTSFHVDMEGGTGIVSTGGTFGPYKILLFDIVAPPGNLTASDGEFAARVQLNWTDNASNEQGFHIYRDGALLDSTEANVHSYSDYDAEPGRVYQYSVGSFVGASESALRSDLGHRPADGSVTGRVSTRAGAPVSAVEVQLDPAPASALLFDGVAGKAEVDGFESGSAALGQFTIEFWMKTTSTAAGTPFSYIKDGSNQANITLESDGKLAVQINASAKSGTHSAQVVNDGRWHHVAVIWNGPFGGQNVSISIDGQAFQSVGSGIEFNHTIATGGSLILGRFPGELDEVRVWNNLRSSADLDAFRYLPVDPSTEGLMLELSVDEGVGPASFDAAGRSEYAQLSGGTFWSQDVAPVVTTALTDGEGNYAIKKLHYGKGVTFKVIPKLGPHQFEPTYKSISLSGGSPVQNEVEFNDISSFTLAGKVLLDGTSCAAAGVQVYLDDVVFGATGEDGRFAIAAGFGSHTLKLKQGDRAFYPASYALQVSADQSGLDFTDKTVRVLSGKVGGGCDQPIGTVQFQVRAEDGCSIVTSSTASAIALNLGPRKYLVQVTDVTGVPAALDRSDILKFFQALGPQTVDLTDSSRAVNLIYRAPIRVEVSGFDEPTCATLELPEGGGSVPAVPVIEQGQKVPLTITVFEDYGNGNHCPLDEGKLTIFDEIIDEQDHPVELEIQNGEAHYTTIANTPNVFPGRIDAQGQNRSFQKSLTAVADVPGRGSITATSWVLVTGHRPRASTFTSTTNEIPLMILRDPPGDGSSSFLEKGQKNCTTFSNIGLQSLSGGVNVKSKTGLKFEKGSPFISTETKAEFVTEDKFRLGLEATEGSGMEICTETVEKWSTPADDGWIGGDGDVLMGAAINLVFAKTDVVELHGCNVEKSEAIDMGAGFNSTYLYTVKHIRDVIIPQLEELARLDAGKRVFYTSQVENWRRQLALNETQKREAPEKKIISFSSGAEYEFANVSDTTKSFDWSVKVFTKNELALGFEFEDSGNGIETQFAADVEFSYEHEGATDSTKTTTTGYTLDDDDPGDSFGVRVRDDSNYGTPVFQTISGRSSCPWEPGTQPRDGIDVRIEPPLRDGVAPGDAAHFVLSVTNTSPSDEEREYFIQPIATTNPDGARVILLGNTFQQLAVNLEPGETSNWELSVERGPSKFRYDDIKIMAVPVCQFEYFRKTGLTYLADTASFSVHYQAPCSDITLFEPRTGWGYNKAQSIATGNKIGLTLTDFRLATSESDSIQAVGAEYRLAGTENWLPVAEIPRGNLQAGKSVQLQWNVASVVDGSYELRAFTRCTAGNTYSTPATGRIDRKPPQVFGTPQPADSLLSLGDEISITFDEDIDCNTVTPDNVSLIVNNPNNTIDSVQIATGCNGRTVILSPVDPTYPQLEGKKLRARVTGIQDLLGNPMVGPNNSTEVAWRTDVRRNVFTWREISISRQAPFRNPGSFNATLVNGTSGALNFSLSGLPVWLSAVPTSGTIAAGDSFPIQLVISPTQTSLNPGNEPKNYTATISANVTSPAITSPLAVQVTIFCAKPAWVVQPADYQYSMTVIAQEQIAGANQSDPKDKIAAFVGGQLRGVASPILVPAVNKWLTFLTVYSNRSSGENVRFQVFDDSDCRLYTGTSTIVRFVADKAEGTTAAPDILNVQDLPAGIRQQIAVKEGWTWISFNLLSPTDMTVNGVLGDLNPATGDLVKSLTQFSQFDPDAGWAGTLGDFNNVEGYALKISEAGTIVHEGAAVPVASTPIPVANGWTWISYLPQVAQPINTALQLLQPQNGDVIKSQTQFAQYLKTGSVASWLGDLGTMTPGLGYRINLSNASVIQNQFKYFAPAVVAALATSKQASSLSAQTGGSELPVPATPEVRALGPDWQVNPSAYPFNMTVTGIVQSDGVALADDHIVLAAMIGDEVRGLSQPQYVDGLNRYLVFLMVYGDGKESAPVTFRLYDTVKQEVLDVDGSINFGPDLVTGSIQQPFALAVRGAHGGEGPLPTEFGLSQSAPNPAKGSVLIRYALPVAQHVVLTLYDISGREVMKLVDGDKDAGFQSVTLDVSGLHGGLYFYRMHAGSFTSAGKMIIVN